MRYLPTGGQMKNADRYTIEELKVPSLTLMERAAGACVDFIKEKEFDQSHICVVCGSGNNGGDGFAIARIFAESGVRVTVIMAGSKEHLTEEALYQKELFEKTRGRICDDFIEDEYSIIIDAVFGVGLCREISGRYDYILSRMNEASSIKVAVDIPSGVSAETGAVLGTAFKADYTVTFQTGKIGLFLYPGREYAGEIKEVDIGISQEPFKVDEETACAPKEAEYVRMLPVRRADSNKGTYGKVLIIAGSRGMSGAAYLNGLGAYRMGAGLVRIYTSEENREILQGQLPEAVITAYELFDERELLRLLEWADVVCIGSGIGTTEKAWKLVRTTLENVTVPCVIDADGLNLLGEHKKYISKLKGKEIIITPHIKEFSRLTGKTVEKIKACRVKELGEFTEKTGITCILKDAVTLIRTGCKRTCVNLSGSAAMAKAGSGDVLAGITAGLLAQGLACYEAAILGTYLHGRAGEYAAEEKGIYSILARDIAENIGEVVKTWTKQLK